MSSLEPSTSPAEAEFASEVVTNSPSEEILPIGDEDRARVLEIIAEIHGASIAARAETLWDWKFIHNPFRQDETSIMLGFKQNGRLLGCVLAIPFLLKTEAGIYPAAWPVDHAMSRAVKSRALLAHSLRMCRMLTEANNFCPGQPVIGLEKLWARAMKMKSVLIGDYFFYYAILKVDQILRTRFRIPGMIAGLGQFLWAIFDAIRRAIIRPYSDNMLQFETVRQIPEEVNQLWEAVAPGIPQMMVRNRAYLEWRFLQMPDPDRYVVRLARRQGQIMGYIVLSIERSNGLKKAVLVDILGSVDDQLLWNGLLSEAIRWARSQQADLLTAVEFSLPELAGLLDKHHFVKGHRFMRFINNTFLPQFRNPEFYERTGWFFTYADHDCEFT